MSFADNLLYIRQYYGVTQESIAEQLNVSRQTVSKWEAGINYPETDKLLLLCDLYNTNLDDLMRGSVKLASEKDTKLYDEHMNRYSRGIVSLVVLVIVGVATMMLLNGLGVPDNISTALFLIFVVVGVLVGIMTGLNHSNFKKQNPLIDPVYSDKVINAFNRKFSYLITTGVGIILIGVIMIVALEADENDIVSLFGFGFSYDIVIAVFLLMVAIAVGILTYAGMQKAKYDRSEISVLTKDGITIRAREGKSAWSVQHKTPQELRRDHVVGSLCGIIMILATIAFFVIGFGGEGIEISARGRVYSSGFSISWVSFIVGGLLCAVVSIAGSMFAKSSEDLVAEARKEDPWIRVDSSVIEQEKSVQDSGEFPKVN